MTSIDALLALYVMPVVGYYAFRSGPCVVPCEPAGETQDVG